MSRTFLLIALSLLLFSPASAEPLPGFLVGTWEGTGDGPWGPFEHKLVVRPILKGRALEFVMEHHRPEGVYEMRGFVIRRTDDVVVATWLDQDGVVADYRARVGPAELYLQGPYGEGRMGARSWAVRSDGSLLYRLQDGSAEALKTLNEAVLRKR